jgi:hypothetical protein
MIKINMLSIRSLEGMGQQPETKLQNYYSHKKIFIFKIPSAIPKINQKSISYSVK